MSVFFSETSICESLISGTHADERGDTCGDGDATEGIPGITSGSILFLGVSALIVTGEGFLPEGVLLDGEDLISKTGEFFLVGVIGDKLLDLEVEVVGAVGTDVRSGDGVLTTPFTITGVLSTGDKVATSEGTDGSSESGSLDLDLDVMDRTILFGRAEAIYICYKVKPCK